MFSFADSVSQQSSVIKPGICLAQIKNTGCLGPLSDLWRILVRTTRHTITVEYKTKDGITWRVDMALRLMGVLFAWLCCLKDTNRRAWGGSPSWSTRNHCHNIYLGQEKKVSHQMFFFKIGAVTLVSLCAFSFAWYFSRYSDFGRIIWISSQKGNKNVWYAGSLETMYMVMRNNPIFLALCTELSY